MSAAAVRRFVASVSVERTCACRATFTVNPTSRLILCPSCSEDAAERARARREAEAQAKAEREAERAAMTCDKCGDPLQVEARLCNWCDPAFDREAEMAALAEMAEPASVAA